MRDEGKRLIPIRCPYCNKKLGEHLEDGSLYMTTCPGCKLWVVVDRRVKSVV